MFQKIIGNDKIKSELIKSVELKKYLHSYIFLGKSGIGKSLIAREFAKMILCESEDEHKCCNKCKSCIEFDSNNNPDFTVISSEGNNIKIEQIRQMQKKIVESPIISKKKVYILDKADTATKEAQNCLLKTLEEPPDFAVIILIGSNESNFLNTIKSRCTILKYEDIKSKDIENYLKNKFELEDISNSIIEAACGSIGKAEELRDKQELYEAIYKAINSIESNSLIDVIKNFDIIYKSQAEKNEILDYINILLFKKAKDNFKYLKCIEIVEETKIRLKANSNYNMCIDNMIMTIWEELH